MKWAVFYTVCLLLIGFIIYDECERQFNNRFLHKLDQLQAKWFNSVIESR